MKKVTKFTPPARPKLAKIGMLPQTAKKPSVPKAPSKPGFLKRAISKVSGALASREAASKGKYARVGNQLIKK